MVCLDINFVFSLTLFTCFCAWLSTYISDYVFLPYMDEQFHVGQAHTYCEGNFTHWDPKITTPPGLYLFSLGLLTPVLRFLYPSDGAEVCSVRNLRLTNVLLTPLNFYLMYAIHCFLIKERMVSAAGRSLRTSAVFPFVLSHFPLLYFFNFLYYTDVGSTFVVLLAYLLALNQRHGLASAVSIVAILFRQTNVVWVVFFAALAFQDVIRRSFPRQFAKVDRQGVTYIKVILQSFVGNLSQTTRISMLLPLVASCSGYAAVIAGFVVFVYLNNGIVLGDREAHQPGIAIPQLFYCAAFILLFAFPHFVTPSTIKQFFRDIRNHPVRVAISAAAIAWIVAVNTNPHPYNLADNRHYTFYIYSRILLRHPIIKYLAVPVYLFAITTIIDRIRRETNAWWTAAFVSCVAASLILQRLLEFRYFILPFLILRLNLTPPLRPGMATLELAAEFALYSVVNFITLYLFLMRPFISESYHELQRFIW